MSVGIKQIRYPSEADAKAAYFDYVKKHKTAIKEAFDEYGEKFANCLGVDVIKLGKLIDIHDDDKLIIEDEINGYVANFYPYEDDGIPDDSYGLRRAIFEKALLNHYHRNPHHPEYWVYVDAERNRLDCKPIDPIYVCEMILDWIANENKEGHVPTPEYWRLNRSSKYIHQDTIILIDMIIDMMNSDAESA